MTDLLDWNGTKWTLRTSPTVPASLDPPPVVTATSDRAVWIAGTAADSDGNAQTLIAHWNGVALSRVASPNPGAPSGVNLLSGVSAAGPDDAWATGLYSVYNTMYHTSQSYPLAERWKGRAWQVSPIPDDGNADQLYAVSAAGPDDVWAVGRYGNPGKTLTEHWNGVKWTILPSPSPGRVGGKADGVLLGVAVVSPRDAWAVGSYVSSPSVDKPLALVLHWNGSSWRQVAVAHYGPKGSPNLLTAVSASSSGNVIAVGYYSGLVGLGQQALVLRLP